MESFVFISDEKEISFNLAIEKYLIEELPPSSRVLYLWVNSPSLVIGRYQNPWEECRVEKLGEDGVVLQRRPSGGGAVYQDEGNICFTIISPEEAESGKSFAMVIDALASLGIEGERSGRNDILVEGRKVSGSAFIRKKGRFCHHGTMLVNTDIDRLSSYLTPTKHKMESHSIKSVRSRVDNLTSFRCGITTSSFAEALTEVFRKENRAEIRHVDKSILSDCPSISYSYDIFRSREWNYGRTPRFTNRITTYSADGEITYYLDVEGGSIKNVGITSDALDTDGIETLSRILKGVQYSASALQSLENRNPFVTKSLSLLSSLIEN